LTCSSKKEGIDGIDLDYEGIQSIEEWRSYLELMVFVADKLNQHSLLLTVALHPGQFLPKQVCAKINRVHVMSYDMVGGPNKKEGHHAELKDVQNAVKSFIDRGCPPSKVILGIPAYSRHGQNPGLVKTYSEIVDDYVTEGQTVGNSDFQQLSSLNGYYFDSPDDVRLKVQYSKTAGLGGIFFWELGQDKQYPGYDGGILLMAAALTNGDQHRGEL
jgi:chitinase